MIALLVAVAMIAGTPPPPLPDPAPQAGAHATVHFAPYTIEVPAINATTGEQILGLYFKCLVPVRWKGKSNRYGHSICKLYARPWADEPVKACAKAIRQKVYPPELYGQCLIDYAAALQQP